MSRYVMIRRLRVPAFLLLVGINAILAQSDILGWSKSWPFYLILAGVLLLAERAALAAEGYPIFPGAPWHGAGQGINQSAPPRGTGQSAATANAAIAPSHLNDFENDREGGQS